MEREKKNLLCVSRSTSQIEPQGPLFTFSDVVFLIDYVSTVPRQQADEMLVHKSNDLNEISSHLYSHRLISSLKRIVQKITGKHETIS